MLVFVLLVLFAGNSRANNRGEDALVNLTLADGLAGETVYRIISDHGGRIWIATSSGISVYNGKLIRNVRFSNANSQTLSPLTYDLCETADKTLYAATEEGLFCLPYGGDSFQRILPQINQPEALFADSNTIYIGGREGLHIYDGKKLKTIPIGAGKKGLDNIVRQCLKGDDGLIWFLSRFDVCSYDPSTGKIQNYGFASQLEARTAVCRFAKIGNKCYVGTKASGLYVYDLSTRVVKHIEGVGSIVTTVESSADGKICVATDGSGAYLINPATDQIEQHFNGLPTNGVYCFHRDANGVNWFGFVRCGLAYNYRSGRFFQPFNTTALSSEGINVRTFCLQKDHYLLGTQNGCWLAGTKGQQVRFFTPAELGGSIVNNIVWYCGEYYIGTFDGGLRILNPLTQTLRKPKLLPQLAAMSIGAIAVAPDSSLWIGCTDGLFIVPYGSKGENIIHLTEQNSHIVGGNIISITFDQQGNAWLTGAKGCSFYSKKSREIIADAFPQGFFNDQPWMKGAVGYDGNIYLRSGPRTFYTSPDMSDFGELTFPIAFTDKWSRNFVDDLNGHYWLSSEKGLFCFSYDLKDWLQLGYGVGLRGDLINDVQLVTPPNSQLLVATSQGLFYANPNSLSIYTSDSTYQVQLCQIRRGSDLLSMEEELMANEEHKLSIGWNFLSEKLQVQAVLPDYTRQANRLYQWRTGKGKWNIIQDGDPIVLQYLLPGNHQLQVRLAGAPGTTATYTISALPSGWAIAETLLLLLSLTVLYLWRKDHSEKRFLQSDREEISEALLEAETELNSVEEDRGGQYPSSDDAASLAGKYQKVKLDEEECKRIVAQLKDYIEKEKVYTNAELKMKDLADVLHLSAPKLSQVFNLYLKENYYEFINRYRLDEFKRLIDQGEYKRYTITALSEQCGFRKSSFFSTFRRIEGMTPAEYLRKHGVKPISG